MHTIPRLVIDLTLVLGVAGVISLIFHRVRLPVMFGYVLAGMLVGPHVPVPLVADRANVQTLADLGVTLLMFSVGLEFNARRLFQAGPSALLMGALQMGCTFFLTSTAAQVMGWSRMEALFTGAAFFASSTMVISKVFEAQPPSKTVRDTVISVSIIQDLGAMVMLTALTTIGRMGMVDAGELFSILKRLGLFLLLLLGLGRLAIPRLVRWVYDHAWVESQVITSVGLCFICAMSAHWMGFPLALGAFVGGALVSESGRARLIGRQILPLRDLFSAIFFVAVGMLINPRVVVSMGGPVLLLGILVMVSNLIGTTAGAMLAGWPLHTGVQAGIALGVVSEFGYIILALGVALGVIRPDLYAVGVAVGLFTTFVMPFALRGAGGLSAKINALFPQRWQDNIRLYQSWADALRRRGIRHGEGRFLRRPFVFLLLDGLLLALLVAAFPWLLRFALPWIEDRLHWAYLVARGVVSAVLGGVAAMLVFGILRQGRILARDLAVLAPSHESGGVARRGRHLLAGGLRVAIVLMVGLPTVAALYHFAPRRPLLAIALGVFATTIYVQLRLAKRLFRETPGGTEWLFAQMQGGGNALSAQDKESGHRPEEH